MSNVAIVILNWNGINFLKEFLPSVIRHSSDVSIYLADNNSTDDSISFTEKNFPDIRIIRLSVNEGYSRGYNLALAQVIADYFILLNSDVEVTPGWIDPVIRLMNSDKMVAACQPKILSYHQKDHFEYAGAAGGFIDKLGYPFCRGRIFETIEKDSGQYNDASEIFWASGACLFIRADKFREAGGFDEDFFAHMEEIDLCWRLKNMGYKIACCPDSLVYHVGGGTLSEGSPLKTFLNFKNGLMLLYKNLPGKSLLTTIFFRMILDGIAAFKFLFTDSYKHFFAVLRAHFYFYKNFKKIRMKRNNNPEAALRKSHKEMYRGLIVLQHFILKKKKFTDLGF